MHKSEGLQAIEKPLASLPNTIRNHILERLRSLAQYEPVIGIMGKTGAGKSSLCNALFQGEVTPISNVSACTRDVLRFRLRNGNHNLMIVDLPGVGESEQRDEEYAALYRHILPELDLVLWVIKADDRALSVDEHFYSKVMLAYQHRVLFVVNQADKAAPCHQWNTTSNTPSHSQQSTIEAKRSAVQQLFLPHHPVCVISAQTGWGLDAMVETMMHSLPDRATSPLTTQLHGRLCTEPVKKQARERFGNAVDEMIGTVESSSFLPEPVRAVIRTVREAVVTVARAVWDWIFF
ncbi:TPA: GTPase family protein [Escherichia coli]|jgi:small GTP-binding protein|uniref:GTPase family protein n=1 Tax=Enterobacterales TaxID=91347 RepID=UPI001427922A|nr:MULTISPECIES: GTPase family protein [Enterobacterales]ELP5716248.1 GTPase family protein [Enterobacter asburiae]EMA4736993.1 GTPase family protein [Enterobacter asburiae]MBK5573727.1 GTPase family protein [Serratia marcescens]QIR65585.1 GTPase family protein [Serratia marcescens]CAD5353208.1 putative GTP-binding protein; CP4-6 prophage [Citrobacter freundii]